MKVCAFLLVVCCVGFSQQALGGAWKLSAQSTNRGIDFAATLVIDQSGTNISGTITFPGDPCIAGTGTDEFVGSTTPSVSVVVESSDFILTFSGGILAGGQISGGTYISKYGGLASGTGERCNPLNGQGDGGTWTAKLAVASPSISSGGVVSAGAFGGFTSAAPGSWIEIYGSNLASDSRSWTEKDFTTELSGTYAPTSLDGTSVIVGGQNAFIDYISPAQVNAQIPSGVGLGPQPLIVKTTTSGTSLSYNLTMDAEQPGLLAPPLFNLGGTQYVTALFSDGVTYVLPQGSVPGLPSRPASVGDVITIYGVGFGSVTPSSPAGQVVRQTNILVAPFHLMFGQTEATLTYAGLAPGAVGLYQFNIVVPNVPSSDTIPLTFTLAGIAGEQTVYIAVQ